MNIEVVGLKEALKELNTIDKKLRRQITTDFKKATQPVLSDARTRLPDKPPLSGMARSWQSRSGAELMNWQPAMVERNLKAFTSGKSIRSRGGYKSNVGVFGIKWVGPQATLFDLARNGKMSAELTARYGPPSRIIYRSYAAAGALVEERVREIVNKVMKQTGNNGRI
jgi:hypothetical protein